MESHLILLYLVIILFSARILGEIAAYFQTPAVIGELVAGIILGPSLLDWIELTPAIQLLAQIGIILLLFEVGLETDLSRLTSSGINATLVAIGGVVLPFAFGFGVSYYLYNFSSLASLFIGSTLTATSIGITLRVLRDLKQQSTNEAQVIIGAAVLDDIIGIVLLSLLFEFSSTGEINLWNAGKVLTFIALFFILSPIAAKLISQIIKKWDEKSNVPGLLPTAIISLILFFAWMAHQMGAPELLGGLAAGLALSRYFFFPFALFMHDTHGFSERVEEKMKPIVDLFTPIFFVAIGLSLDLKHIQWNSSFIWIFTGALLFVAILGKLMSGLFLLGETWMKRLIIGTAMIPRGEVGLIFANVGLTTKVFEDEVYASIIFVIAITTFLAPFLLRLIYSRVTPQEQTNG